MTTSTASTLPPDLTEKLSELRDIRLPDPISIWPLAPGWWVLLAIIIATIITAIVAIHRHRRSLRYRALQELDQLRKTTGSSSTATLRIASDVSVLLRRIMLATPNQSSYATLHGDAWEAHLLTEPTRFPSDVARLLSIAPYAPESGNSSVGTDITDQSTSASNALSKIDLHNDSLHSVRILDAAQSWIRSHT